MISPEARTYQNLGVTVARGLTSLAVPVTPPVEMIPADSDRIQVRDAGIIRERKVGSSDSWPRPLRLIPNQMQHLFILNLFN